MKHRRAITLGAVLLIYFGSYAIFSLNGRYITGNHGGTHWTKSWAPLHLVEPYRAPTGRQGTSITVWGVPYFPCLFLDRLIWHRNQDPEV